MTSNCNLDVLFFFFNYPTTGFGVDSSRGEKPDYSLGSAKISELLFRSLYFGPTNACK